MAQLHNALRYYTDLTRGLKRALGLQGEDEGTSRVSETLTPVFDPFRYPEHVIHRGEIRFTGWADLAAGGAGTFGKAVIRNVGTRLVVVERVYLRSGLAASWRLSRVNLADGPPSGFVLTSQYLVSDGRHVVTPTTDGRMSEQTDAATPGAVFAILGAPADTIVVWTWPIILAPNEGVCARILQANQDMSVTFCWRERQPLPGELNP